MQYRLKEYEQVSLTGNRKWISLSSLPKRGFAIDFVKGPVAQRLRVWRVVRGQGLAKCNGAVREG